MERQTDGWIGLAEGRDGWKHGQKDARTARRMDGYRQARLMAQFKALDKDGDALISAVELQESMLSSGHKASRRPSWQKKLVECGLRGFGIVAQP